MTATASGTHTIELRGGRYLDLADPDPAAITLDDIAHGLAHTCRYAGQCERFYSVAEHATLVATHLQAEGACPLVALAGLHHDDAEAFLGDVTAPLKALLPDYRALEARMHAAIAQALELPDAGAEATAVVEAADRWALAAETWQLTRSRGQGWFCDGLYRPDRDGPLTTLGVTPEQAKHAYLAAHHTLTGQLRYWTGRQAA